MKKVPGCNRQNAATNAAWLAYIAAHSSLIPAPGPPRSPQNRKRSLALGRLWHQFIRERKELEVS